ncbi:FadR/GntR family transcriptional regulator [Compostimonas suwonensis]|uniref:DNA-binding FadR family transcriptional regulator n=1 Tax=Compostimonas suwonensis TaxID=1048394 RepID=A0A2M9C3A6_9MICO|nr:FadR/GntR family transcriptional regulator [Compostimonas suwonensis]PJJ64998.1 DNA-binding FadR family transcriptional regulator [Compostimonas suwonensis]
MALEPSTAATPPLSTDGVAARDELSALAESIGSVARESVVSVVARRLLDQLTTGRIAPGTRLPSERQLAASLEVGRSAVREALAALDLLGIVDIRPGSGTYLRGSSSDLLPRIINWGLMLGQPRTHDLVEIRQHLEILSASLAAQRATDDDLAAIGQRLEQMEAAADDMAAFVEADVAFHLEVARTARNSVLIDILHSVRELLRVWVQRTSQDSTVTHKSLAEHAAIFEAISNHDSETAMETMRAHMTIASSRLKESLEEDSRS